MGLPTRRNNLQVNLLVGERGAAGPGPQGTLVAAVGVVAVGVAAVGVAAVGVAARFRARGAADERRRLVGGRE
jgi:hypothetical protein